MTAELTILNIGPGLVAVAEQDILKELSKIGITHDGLIALLSNIGVPRIHAPAGVFIDIIALQLAWRAITAVGGRDFYLPGHPNYNEAPVENRCIDLERFEGDHAAWIKELIYARRVDYGKITPQMRDQLSEAASRMGMEIARRASDVLNHEAQRKFADDVTGEGVEPHPIGGGALA